MAVAGWVLDTSAVSRWRDASVARELAELAGDLCVCPVGELEQLYSATSSTEYDRLQVQIHESFRVIEAPPDVIERALALQRDLAHHHGMWHRTPIPDLFIAETALHHEMGVVHVDRHYDRIAEVRPLTVRRIG